nr:hypothetical protein [Tanacetum cinerariifolium]
RFAKESCGAVKGSRRNAPRKAYFTSSFGLINQTPNQTPIDWEMLKGSCSNAKFRSIFAELRAYLETWDLSRKCEGC